MYIPPSQYQTGFISNGNYNFVGGGEYIGPYWELLNGKKYSGESPNDSSREIIENPTNNNTSLNNPDNISTPPGTSLVIPVGSRNPYGTKPRSLPLPYVPNITQDDINKGHITRYFAKRNDSFQYIEIDGFDYNIINARIPTISWDLYGIASILWKIKGDTFNVIELNKNKVLEIESVYSPFFPNGRNWIGFSQIFKDDYLQFYQGVQENLSTLGGEYKTSDSKEYIGLYHIHPKKGPMVGPIHVTTPHDYLYPIKRNIKSRSTGSISPTTPSYTPPPSTGGGSYGGGGY